MDHSHKKNKLSKEQYNICFEGGTDAPFKGKYWDHKETGTYYCVCCGNALFHSFDKFESHSGWPSYTKPCSPDSIKESEDGSVGMRRIEISCGECGAHLGHVFPDGPPPTGLRYCINSTSLRFEEKE